MRQQLATMFAALLLGVAPLAATAEPGCEAAPAVPSELEIVNGTARYFVELPSRFNSTVGHLYGGVYQFIVTGVDGGSYNIVVDGNRISVERGMHPQPNILLAMSSNNFAALAAGTLDLQAAVSAGEVAVTGNLGLVYAWRHLFPSP